MPDSPQYTLFLPPSCPTNHHHLRKSSSLRPITTPSNNMRLQCQPPTPVAKCSISATRPKIRTNLPCPLRGGVGMVHLAAEMSGVRTGVGAKDRRIQELEAEVAAKDAEITKLRLRSAQLEAEDQKRKLREKEAGAAKKRKAARQCALWDYATPRFATLRHLPRPPELHLPRRSGRQPARAGCRHLPRPPELHLPGPPPASGPHNLSERRPS